MGKTSKKAAPGGDERNMYERRLKSTNATSKISETILPERQRESDGLNRPKLTGIQKTIPTAQGKHCFKSKLRSPTKFGINNPTKRLGKVTGTSNLEKKLTETVKNTAVAASTMQPETQETDTSVSVTIQKENSKVEVDHKKIVVETENEEQTPATDKQNVDHAVSEESSTVEKEVEMKPAEVSENGEKVETEATENKTETPSPKETVTEPSPKQVISQESNNNETREELSDSDIKLSLDCDEESTKPQNHEQPNVTEVNNEVTESKEVEQEIEQNVTNDEEKVSEESEATSNDTKSITNDKEEQHSESQTDTESSLADTIEKGGTSSNNDSSFVSFDASIVLKDVQIKLNDCLKENSKLYDVSSPEKSTVINASKDMSFGKTLRNISGRNSINRMRHVTVRENRLSPNSSLYVNTSVMSMTQDETGDHKVYHRGSVGSSETQSTNGSPVERKRKLGDDHWSSTKKPKVECESSLLNTSIGYLKSLRRPVQSTPNKAGYKFQAEKLNISGISSSGDDEKTLEQNEGMRKWCVIM